MSIPATPPEPVTEPAQDPNATPPAEETSPVTEPTISELTPEQLEQQGEEFMRGFFNPGKRRKPIAADPEPAEPTEEPAEPATPAAPATPETPPPPATPHPAAPPAPVHQVAPPVEEFFAKPQAQTAPVVPPPAPAQPAAVKLTDKDRRTIEVLQQMGKSNPQHSGLAEQYVDFLGRESTYARTWTEANPGQRFNPDDEDHSHFYAQYEPKIDQDAYDQGKEDLIIARAKREWDATHQQEMARIQKENRVKEAKQVVPAATAQAKAQLLRGADPTLVEGLAEDATVEAIGEAIATKDRTAKVILDEEAEKMAIQISELHELAAGADLNPRKSVRLSSGELFYPHQSVEDITTHYEEQLLREPPERTMEKGTGRRLISNAQWDEAIQKIVKSTATQPEKAAVFKAFKAKYWTLETPHYADMITWEHTERAKRRIAAIRGTQSAAKPPVTAAKPAAPADPASAKPAPIKRPSVVTSSDHVDTNGAPQTGETQEHERITGRFFPGGS